MWQGEGKETWEGEGKERWEGEGKETWEGEGKEIFGGGRTEGDAGANSVCMYAQTYPRCKFTLCTHACAHT